MKPTTASTVSIDIENELLTLHSYIKELESNVENLQKSERELKAQNLKLTRSNATFKANSTRRKMQKSSLTA
jgi:hypothetical protein